jgi:hypothetical protein
MDKIRYKVVLNWQGGVHEYYRYATSKPQALRHSIRSLAREVGYTTRYVRNHIMDTGARRWEVSK